MGVISFQGSGGPGSGGPGSGGRGVWGRGSGVGVVVQLVRGLGIICVCYLCFMTGKSASFLYV